MAFKIHSVLAESPAWLYLPTNAATYTVGLAMVDVSGYLTTVSSGSGQDTALAHYICMADAVVATDGDTIPVIKAANDSVIWETTLYDDDADMLVGEVHTLHTDGAQITATTTSGCFEIVEYVARTAGSVIRGIFIK
jgi:hypothetical protein